MNHDAHVTEYCKARLGVASQAERTLRIRDCKRALLRNRRGY